MIKSLYIKNLAIIDELSIDFSSGFNVFTGETGAGKSIIVGALSLLAKGRSDSSIIRTGANKAIIEGVFSIDDSKDIKDALDEADIEYDDEMIIRRTFSSDNKSSIKINQSTVTLSFLESLMSGFVDIHSQRDNQYLFNKKNHIYLLDRFSFQDDELKNSYKSLYEAYIKEKRELDDLLNQTYNESEIEFVKYSYDEINNANLSVDEEEELTQLEEKYKSREKYIELNNAVFSLYKEDNGIKDKMYSLVRTIKNSGLDVDSEELDNLYYDLDEKVEKILKQISVDDYDSFDIEKVEERLYLYSRLKHKYNKSIEELNLHKESLKSQLDFYYGREEVLDEKKKRVDAAKKKAVSCALELSSIRKNKAKELEESIVSECTDLMLNNVQFVINFDEKELSNDGIDDIEFYISLNKGQDPKPLKNVASGGEASRLMLALKTVFSSLSKSRILVFDEIDNGVSGKVAHSMGLKMATIAKKAQVFSITHLSPVAACANTHYFIYKDNASDLTKTNIRELDEESIIRELASISSGEINDKSIEAAKELYINSQKIVEGL